MKDKDYPVAKCCERGVWTGIAYVRSLPATLYIKNTILWEDYEK